MLAQYFHNIIVLLIADFCVETSLAFAGIDYIPKCNVIFPNNFSSLLVICREIFFEKLKNNLPELVLWMCVIYCCISSDLTPGTEPKIRILESSEMIGGKDEIRFCIL